MIISGGVVGGYLGSKLTPRINTKVLVRIFSLLLIATAYRMIFSTSVNTLYENNIFLYFFIFINSYLLKFKEMQSLFKFL